MGFSIPLRALWGIGALLAGSGNEMAAAEDNKDSSWFSGSVGLASDYTFRGVSQTMGKPSLQLYAAAEFASGFYAYAWASNVDFQPDTEPDDGARYEIDLAIGYTADISEKQSLDLSLVRLSFPNTVDGIKYDYNELTATLHASDFLAATAGYSWNVDGTDQDARYYKLATSFDLADETELKLAYGHFDLTDAYDARYSYLQASIGRYFSDSLVMLTFIDTFGAADEIFYEQTIGSRWVLAIEYAF